MASSNGDGDRNELGHFAQGNRVAAGNGQSRRMAALRKELLDSLPAGTVGRVGAKLAELAEGGDIQAAKLLLEHVVGRPLASVALVDSEGQSLTLGLQELTATILATLEGHPAAQYALALKLKGIVQDAGRTEQTGE